MKATFLKARDHCIKKGRFCNTKLNLCPKLHVVMAYMAVKLKLHAFWVQVYSRDNSMGNVFFSLPVSITAAIAQSV